jgi:hypothetical protein
LADKPGHIIEIPDSLGRDVDAFREGRGPAPGVEAFMSPAALKQAEAQTAAAAAPVHAEDLVPITAAEAAARTTFGGEALPPGLPRLRRVIPAPYQRERISIGRHGRTWQPCTAGDIEVGDTVPGLGLVVRREEVVRYETVAGVPGVATGMDVKLTGKGGIERPYDPGTPLRAHRRSG